MMSCVSRTLRPRFSWRALSTPLATAAGLIAVCGIAGSQTVVGSYAADYTVGFNGSITGVSTNYGGLIFKQSDFNTLLINGSANNGGGTLYSVPVVRGAGNHITGFGAAVFFSTAPNNDGGLVYTPNGNLLFTEYSNNQLGEIKPGSVAPDKTISLPGVTSSVGTLQYVPAGFSNAGQLKIVSYSGGNWFDAVLTDDGSGTHNVSTSATGITTGSGPEGVVYVHSGNPDFAVNSILVSEFSAGRVSAYTADANGDPVVGSRQDFITGLGGAEGGTIDPATGDFVFSTFGASNKVVVIQGFTNQAAGTPEPGSVALLVGAGLSGSVFALRRRRSRK